MPTRVILADDHRILREGLRALLESLPDVEVVAEAVDGKAAVELARTLRPHVVVIDVGMPGLNGIEATRRILAEVAGVKVIGLTMHSDARFVSAMLQAGASGYLLKDCAFEELARALETVVGGRTYLSPAISQTLVKDYVRHLATPVAPGTEKLSPREKEVLQLLAEGQSTKAMAERLQVSPKTVDTHRQQLMRKLGLHSVASLTKYAVREGLTSLEV